MTDYLGPYLLGPNETEENGIYTGDARELARAIPDESVDLVFTDPVYQNIEDYRWLAETAARVLRQHKSVLAFVGHTHTVAAASAMLPYLKAGPILEHYVGGAVGRLFSHSVQCNVLPCLWFSKETPDNAWMAIQELSTPKGQRGHRWGKAQDMAFYRISRLSKVDEVVVDPFCGGGSTVAMCKMLGRQYLAFEIEPDVAEMARERVRTTQPPLFVPQPTQEAMTL